MSKPEKPFRPQRVAVLGRGTGKKKDVTIEESEIVLDVNLDGVTSGVSLDVNVQDHTTPAILLPFHKIYHSTNLAVDMVQDEYTFTVVDAGAAANGDEAIIFNPAIQDFSHYNVVTVNGNIVTVDSLIDVPFPTGSYVDFGSHDMSVNGLTTPQIFGVRGHGTGNPPVGISFDMTRIVIMAQTDGAVDLAKFADRVRLLRGLMLRKHDANGDTHNILNFKSNGELAAYCYDWTPYLASNPNQGQNGFAARLTFAGQSKIGVVVRVGPGEDVEFIVQDDLSDIEHYMIMAEGHVVNPN